MKLPSITAIFLGTFALLLAVPDLAFGQVPSVSPPEVITPPSEPTPAAEMPAKSPVQETHGLTKEDAEAWLDGFMPYALQRGDIAGAVVAAFFGLHMPVAAQSTSFAQPWEVSAGTSEIRRIAEACNSQPFSHLHAPGIAVGGHCIPVYPWFYLAGDPDATIVQATNDELTHATLQPAITPR
jgi:hypothetical protein